MLNIEKFTDPTPPPNNLDTNLNKITNDLINEYDINFNHAYNVINTFNSTINNKEDLLVKENLEISEKDRQIDYLYTVLIYVILFGIVLMAHAMNKIDVKMLIIATIVIIILLAITIFVLYKNSVHIQKLLKNIHVEMPHLKDIIKNPYTCPSNCESNDDKGTSNSALGYKVNNYPTLNTNQQNNYWKNGDYSGVSPAGTFIENFTNPNHDTAVQYSTTYHECKWIGGNKSVSNGLPIEDGSIISSEPCSFKEGYVPVLDNNKKPNKYLCKGNPDKTTGFSVTTNCTKI